MSVPSSFSVIDHSVQVDFSGDQTSLLKNQNLEFERNKERFQFLKWGSDAFDGLEIVPPGSGIVHQVNLEYHSQVLDGLGLGFDRYQAKCSDCSAQIWPINFTKDMTH